MFRRSIAGGVVVALVAAWIVFSFALRTTPTYPSPNPPVTGVVFTGQFDRIDVGLDLMEKGKLSLLFISGVNQGAGLNPANFSVQFDLRGALARDLAEGRIILATDAQDTLENALEASCWLAQHPSIKDVVLITSPLHMPRASLVLERASRVKVERLPVGADTGDYGDFRSSEFWKYTGTWFLTLLPTSMWPARSGLSCNRTY
jgi:uncharacterized SAM-binding protein YcdF (DUF218 family)